MVRINLNRLKFYTGQRSAARADVHRIQTEIEGDRKSLVNLSAMLKGREEFGIVYPPSEVEIPHIQSEIQATEEHLALQLASLGPAQARLLDTSQFADTLLNYARQMGANLEGIN